MIEVFTTGAPSPRKVTIMLEELGLAYEWHWVNVCAGEQKQGDFLAKNPNARLPAIIDHDAEGGPLLLWESTAILLYLAEKSVRFLPASPGIGVMAAKRHATTVRLPRTDAGQSSTPGAERMTLRGVVDISDPHARGIYKHNLVLTHRSHRWASRISMMCSNICAD